MFVLALIAKLVTAASFTYVPIAANSSIQADLMSTFPTGIFTANNALETPFSIPSTPNTCGPSGGLPCNYYRFGLNSSGTSITINTSVSSPTDVYTLLNAYNPAQGQQLGTIKFVGTGGTSVTFALIGGEDIRDIHQSIYADTLANGVPGVQALNAFMCVVPTTCTDDSGLAPPGTYFVDEQHFSLGSTFAGQTLTEIILTDTNNSSVPILLGVTVASQGSPSIGGVVSASDYGKFPETAPGSQIEIYGSNLARGIRAWSGADFTNGIGPTSLEGTSVSIGGKAAFVDYISPGQVNVVVPSDVPTGLQQLTVTTAAGTSSDYQITVNALEPGLLAPAAFKIGGTQYVAAFFPDNSAALPAGAITGLPSHPAKPGDIVTLYGIGFGPVIPNIPAGQIVEGSNKLASSFEMSIGGLPATVQYAGLAPNYTGLYQINVVVPNVSGNSPLTFTLGATAGTQTLYLSVEN